MPQTSVFARNKTTKLVRSCAIRDENYETDDNVTNATAVILPTTVTFSITQTATIVTDSESVTLSLTETTTTTSVSSTISHQKHYQKQFRRHQSPVVKGQSNFSEFRPSLSLTSSQFLEFFYQAINKTARDQAFLLFIEGELISFTKDFSQIEYHVEETLSYYRLLVHRCAELFGMEHNVVRNTNRIILRKTDRTQLPSFPFNSFIRDFFTVPIDTYPSNNFRSYKIYRKQYLMDTNNNEKITEVPKRVLLKRSGDVNQNSSYEDNIVSKEVLYYEPQEIQAIEQAVDDNANLVDFDVKSRSLSFEEREEQYDKARRRIFDSATANDWVSNVEEAEWNDDCQVKLLKEETSTSKTGTVSLLTRTSTTDSTSSASNGVQTSSRLSPSASSGYKSITQSQYSESFTSSPTTMIALEMPGNECTNLQQTNDESAYIQGNENNWNEKINEEQEKSQKQQLQQQCSMEYANYQNNYIFELSKIDVIPPGSIIINPNTGVPFVNADGTLYYYDPSNIPEFLLHSMYSTPMLSYVTSSQSMPIYTYQQEKMILSNNIPQSTDTNQIPIVSAVTTRPYAYSNYQDSINNNGQTTTAINCDYNLQYLQQHYVPVSCYYANDVSDLNANALGYNYVPVQTAQYLMQNQLPSKDYQIINSRNVIDLSSQFAGMNLASQQCPLVSSDSFPLTQTADSNMSSITQLPTPTTNTVKYSNVNKQVLAMYFATQAPNQKPLSNECAYVTSACQATNVANTAQDNNVNVQLQQQSQQLYSIYPSQTNQAMVQSPAMNATTTTTTQGPQLVFYQPRSPQVPVNYQQMINPNVLYNSASPIQQFATVVNPYLQSLQHQKHKMYSVNATNSAAASSFIQMQKNPHSNNTAAVAAAAAAAASNSYSTIYGRSNSSTSSHGYHHGKGFNSRPGYRNTRSYHQYSNRQRNQTMAGRMNPLNSDLVTNFIAGSGSGRTSKSINNRGNMQKFHGTFRHNGGGGGVGNVSTTNSVMTLTTNGAERDDNAENTNNTAD